MLQNYKRTCQFQLPGLEIPCSLYVRASVRPIIKAAPPRRLTIDQSGVDPPQNGEGRPPDQGQQGFPWGRPAPLRSRLHGVLDLRSAVKTKCVHTWAECELHLAEECPCTSSLNDACCCLQHLVVHNVKLCTAPGVGNFHNALFKELGPCVQRLGTPCKDPLKAVGSGNFHNALFIAFYID